MCLDRRHQVIVLLISKLSLGRLSCLLLFPVFLSTWNIAFLALHILAGVYDVEQEDCDPHWCCIEDVHEHFVVRNTAVDTLGVLDQTEDDTDLIRVS